MRVPAHYIVAGVAAVAVIAYLSTKKAADLGQSIGAGAVDLVGGVLTGAVNAIPAPINPTSTENVVYGGVNAVGGWMTRDDNWTLGGQIYDWTN